MGALDPAAALVMTFHVIAIDQREDEIRAGVELRRDCSAQIRAETCFELVGVVLQSGYDLAAIAPGCAPSGLGRFDDHHLATGLREMNGCAQAGVAGANDATSATLLPLNAVV